jgi:hypothetical protein
MIRTPADLGLFGPRRFGSGAVGSVASGVATLHHVNGVQPPSSVVQPSGEPIGRFSARATTVSGVVPCPRA